MSGAAPSHPQEDIAAALGRVPSGLFVATARRGEDETSFLASWVMQAGFAPPTLSVGVGLNRPARGFMEPLGSRFAISVIGNDERKLLGPFFRPVGPGPRALDGFAIERTPSGLAVLRGCLAWLECQTRSAIITGDHVIVLGEVVAGRMQHPGEPTFHVRANGLDY